MESLPEPLVQYLKIRNRNIVLPTYAVEVASELLVKHTVSRHRFCPELLLKIVRQSNLGRLIK